MEILGYPTFVLMREARSPAVSAPKKAAAAGGKPARSTSSRRKVLDSVLVFLNYLLHQLNH